VEPVGRGWVPHHWEDEVEGRGVGVGLEPRRVLVVVQQRPDPLVDVVVPWSVRGRPGFCLDAAGGVGDQRKREVARHGPCFWKTWLG
jgi:hypothetical protein